LHSEHRVVDVRAVGEIVKTYIVVDDFRIDAGEVRGEIAAIVDDDGAVDDVGLIDRPGRPDVVVRKTYLVVVDEGVDGDERIDVPAIVDDDSAD
jgi:hypothetical protein